MGIWRKTGMFSLAAEVRGRYVLFCPPDTDIFRSARDRGMLAGGRCAGDYVPMIKQVVGVEDDLVEVGGNVKINGTDLASSEINADVAKTSRLSQPNWIRLDKGSVWLMSTYTPRSFDSRYFGAISAATIESFIEPVFTW
jgi:conjugative transfer signal peptidase TraF